MPTLPTIIWAEYPKSFKVSLPDREDVVYGLGDTVWYSDRKDVAILITGIIGREDDNGPKGFTYLPWRDEEKRWASKLLSLKGDARFVVCYPSGNLSFGLHIDWTTFCHKEHPDKEHTAFIEFVQKLKKR